MEGVAWVRSGPGVTMLKRIENEGMDFAAHNTSMTYAMDVRGAFWGSYAYYIFLNSSVKGPFVPKYYPAHWATPFTSRIRGDVRAVGSSLVCLPAVDAGALQPMVLLLLALPQGLYRGWLSLCWLEPRHLNRHSRLGESQEESSTNSFQVHEEKHGSHHTPQRKRQEGPHTGKIGQQTNIAPCSPVLLSCSNSPS